MAHFAEIDSNNIVTRVLVVANEQEHRGQDFLANDLGLGGNWIQTSYNANFRKHYAGIGMSYDASLDAFIPPRPDCHPLAVNFIEETCTWSCPDASHVIIIGE